MEKVETILSTLSLQFGHSNQNTTSYQMVIILRFYSEFLWQLKIGKRESINFCKISYLFWKRLSQPCHTSQIFEGYLSKYLEEAVKNFQVRDESLLFILIVSLASDIHFSYGYTT